MAREDDYFLALPEESRMDHGSWQMLRNSPALHPAERAQFQAADDDLQMGRRPKVRYQHWRVL